MKSVVTLEPWHVLQIIGDKFIPGITTDQMIEAYFSKGSVGYCLLIDDAPVAAAGIMNLGWHRGEAWLLHRPPFGKYLFKLIREMLPRLAQINGFRRLQATCFTGSSTLFEHLGFEREGTLKAFGPNGETAEMYSRIF
jgi:hypothetical protein